MASLAKILFNLIIGPEDSLIGLWEAFHQIGDVIKAGQKVNPSITDVDFVTYQVENWDISLLQEQIEKVISCLNNPATDHDRRLKEACEDIAKALQVNAEIDLSYLGNMAERIQN